MPERERDGSDAFRAWMEANRALFESGAGPVWSQAEALFRAWGGFAEGLAGAHAERHGGPGASPFDPAGWLRGPGTGGMADLMRWLEGPGFADLWTEERRAVRGMREWLAFLTASEQMRTVLGDAWLRTFRDFAGRLAAVEGPVGGWEGVLALWQQAADAETARLYRSAAFLAAQRDLMAAETDLRRAIRERVERMAEMVGLPTRREMDDMARTLHAMRREMRRMRSAAAAGGGGRGGP